MVQHDFIAKLAPGGEPAFAQLSDDDLLANTRRLVGRSNQLLAALLAHLAEVEARGVHRLRSCASLYTYCIYELRFSEDAAARRSAAARLTKAFPALLEAIAAGELHLTGLLMIGPHLTLENHAEVLARAKFRTKKELSRLVRELNPLPGVPDVIEPLGIIRGRTTDNPTCERLVAASCPPARQLPAEDHPATWANDGFDPLTREERGNTTECRAPAPVGDARPPLHEAAAEEALPVGPVPRDLPPVTGPQHFQMRFATVEEHVQLVERARALLARQRPAKTLGELHLEAMKLLVQAFEKQRFAVISETKQQRSAVALASTEKVAAQSAAAETPAARRSVSEFLSADSSPRCNAAHGSAAHGSAALGSVAPESPRQRGRHVPAAVRRKVYARDGARCTFIDERGERCCETHYLELHHLRPFAKNGAHSLSNLTVRCTAHNALAAEQDFGPRLMAERRSCVRHESARRASRHEAAPHGVRAAAGTDALAQERPEP